MSGRVVPGASRDPHRVAAPTRTSTSGCTSRPTSPSSGRCASTSSARSGSGWSRAAGDRAPRGPGAPGRDSASPSGAARAPRSSRRTGRGDDPEAPLRSRTSAPEREIAEFERLKPRLAEVWDALTMRDEEPHTSVVVPSLTLDQSELTKIAGASFYEERLLFLLIRLRNPRARDGLRDLAARPPDHPRVLLPVPRRDPGEPRPLAPDAALRRRRLAALAHREDPRAARG